MQIGIGLPTTSDVRGELLLDWAKMADAGLFSSLGVLDRLVYRNYEALISLAVAAGATQRIRLMTTVLLAPLHSAAMLAKQAASLDALSNGRLTLGLGIGGREDDFQAAGVPYYERGKRFDAMLETMHRIWAGEPMGDGIGAIGPKPAQQGGPEMLIGGYSPAAIQRVARWGEGFIAGGSPPAQSQQGYRVAEQAWKEAGRSGKPRFVCSAYFGLGENAKERAGAYLRHYYAFAGPMADAIADSVSATPEAVKQTIQTFRDIGADELMLWPCIAELDQVDRLAQLVR
jgi:alkanesulfonate monooxygenase SsuD/methylene tetrahydromethanopterin reductase-like flavin-dependent oxidoreductase (luciferase family)